MTYTIKNLDTILEHWPKTVRRLMLHDGNFPAELDAQVASGDYFALLATRLDQVSQHLKDNHHQDYGTLEASIKELLYLHSKYRINKKS